jgi:microcystin-dependent protein
MANQYLGEIRMVGFNFAPQGWYMCNGQTLAISSNAALFALLGTTYGGNGTTTFQLPNLQGRVPIHQGTGLSTYVMGENGGVESVTVALNQMPSHTHQVNCDGQATGRGGSTFGAGVGETPVNNYPALTASPAHAVYSASHNATMNAAMLSSVGGATPVTNLQPFLTVNFIIAFQGIFPSRS